MGNNTILLLTTTALLLSLLLSMVRAQFEPPVGPSAGKPCSSSFHCWRTEPINVFGEPVGLAVQGNRRKRLEVGNSFSKGGRCRCIEGSCAQFQQRTQSFLPCEEF